MVNRSAVYLTLFLKHSIFNFHGILKTANFFTIKKMMLINVADTLIVSGKSKA